MEENSDIEQQIEQRISELPQDIQNVILASDFNQKIQTIGAANKLHIDQLEELSNMTMLVMLGFIPTSEFEKEITTQLQISGEVAHKVVEDINTQIFLAIRESMKQFASTFQKQEAAVAVPTPAPIVEQQPTSTELQKAPAAADIMLSQKTVSVAPEVPTQSPPKPNTYKADPYREPTN